MRRGQAAVESAIVIPLMTFLILGVLQLAMIQHAKIMTEYAAFNACRSGIVWNADKWIMESAAIISLLPTYEGLASNVTDPETMVKRIVQRALLYQLHRRLPDAVNLINGGTDALISQFPDGWQGGMSSMRDQIVQAAAQYVDQTVGNMINDALGGGSTQMVTVNILNPTNAGTFDIDNREMDFDDVRKGDSFRKKTRLVINVHYLYMMRIPFANWIIHQAWRAQRASVRLYGSIYAAHSDASHDQMFWMKGQKPNVTGGDSEAQMLGRVADESNVYFLPLDASYTLRMQSNPYSISLRI